VKTETAQGANKVSDETNAVSPMVMKHAKALFACDKAWSANDHADMWEQYKNLYLGKAQAVLTACGALECLGALEGLYECREYGALQPDADAWGEGHNAIANVYGSAPE